MLSLWRALNEAIDDADIAGALVSTVQEATECQRVVVSRPVSIDEFELLASSAARRTQEFISPEPEPRSAP